MITTQDDAAAPLDPELAHHSSGLIQWVTSYRFSVMELPTQIPISPGLLKGYLAAEGLLDDALSAVDLEPR